MVILDEIEFMKQHLVSATMRDRWPTVLNTLTYILQSAKYVFLLQHWISKSTVCFIADMISIDLSDQKLVTSIIMNNIAPTSKIVVLYSDNRKDVYLEMIPYLILEYKGKVMTVYMNKKDKAYEYPVGSGSGPAND